MSTRVFAYKVHKWLAVAAGLVTLFWFTSGIVLLLPRSWWEYASGSLPHATYSPQANLREMRISPAEALLAVDQAMGRPAPVEGIHLRQLGDQLVYEISVTGSGTHLVSGRTGEYVVIAEATAVTLAQNAVPSQSRLPAPDLLRKHDRDYGFGPLPAYRFSLQDSHGTRVYVAKPTGEIQITHRLGRIREFLIGLHFLRFLRPLLPDLVVRLTLLAFAGLGLLMAILGGWILYLQFRTWWHTARRTA